MAKKKFSLSDADIIHVIDMTLGMEDNVDLLIGQHFIQRAVDTRDAKLGGFLLCFFPFILGQGQDVDPIAAQAFL